MTPMVFVVCLILEIDVVLLAYWLHCVDRVLHQLKKDRETEYKYKDGWRDR